jgi:hypothetical protein
MTTKMDVKSDERIVDDTDDRLSSDGEADGNAAVREA